MWFTDEPCDYENEKWYWLLSFVVLVTGISILMRQLLGVEEMEMYGIVIGTIASIGLLFVVVTIVVKLCTGGCFGINEWWIFLSIVNYFIVMIVNELTVEVSMPVAMLPFFFSYPAITIKASDRDAAIASIISFGFMIGAALVCYYIISTSSWWYYGVIFSGASFTERLYRFIVGGIYLGSSAATIIGLLPLKINNYALPGYWTWKYRDTAILSLIVISIDLYLLVFGGVLRTLMNVGYRGFAVV